MSRIIAGRAKGTRLSGPTDSSTRPTTDRLREAIFSSLVSWVGTTDSSPAEQLEGIAFLDLFAGTGAVGLEAASRGAQPVVLVENSFSATRVIDANLRATKLAGRVVTTKVTDFLARKPDLQFDIIFADPPYGLPADEMEAMLAEIIYRGWLADNGMVVLERAKGDRLPIETPELVDRWERNYSGTVVHYLPVQRLNR